VLLLLGSGCVSWDPIHRVSLDLLGGLRPLLPI
jgi:hypothetical protein